MLVACESDRNPSIDYPGEVPAGLEAIVFAPGLVTTKANEHSPMSFSPDGSVALWAVMDSKYRGRLFEISYSDGKWSAPSTPSFADTISDHYCPSFSPDGKTLYFSSRRQAPEGYATGRGNRIWSVSRTTSGWGTPVPFDTTVSKAQEFSHSISAAGTIYFSAAVGSDMNIFKAEKNGAGYAAPVMLPGGINTAGYEDGPYIAADESFLIFESTRPEGIESSHDLYISFKNDTDQWSAPVNLGPKVNSAAMERFPRLSPDGKYLFFASNRDQSDGKVGFDFYWIDVNAIDAMAQAIHP